VSVYVYPNIVVYLVVLIGCSDVFPLGPGADQGNGNALNNGETLQNDQCYSDDISYVQVYAYTNPN
jgi:hypothetical protein